MKEGKFPFIYDKNKQEFNSLYPTEENLEDYHVIYPAKDMLFKRREIAEKILKIIAFLKGKDGYSAVSYQNLYEFLKIDLRKDTELLDRLTSENNVNVT